MRRKVRLFLLAALIAGPAIFLILYSCESMMVAVRERRLGPLVSGTMLPSEMTLSLGTSQAGNLELRGTFQKGERKLRFITERGQRMPIFERASGAVEFEISGCFLDEQGRTLMMFMGGDVLASECGMTPDSDLPETTPDDMAFVSEAMQAIANLQFRPEYESEQRMLTGALALKAAIEPLDRVLSDQRAEGYRGGEVILDADHLPAGGGISIP